MECEFKVRCEQDFLQRLNAFCKQNSFVRNTFVLKSIENYIDEKEQEKNWWAKELEARRKLRFQEKMRLRQAWKQNMEEKELNESVRDWKAEEFENRIKKRMEEYKQRSGNREVSDDMLEEFEQEESYDK